VQAALILPTLGVFPPNFRSALLRPLGISLILCAGAVDHFRSSSSIVMVTSLALRLPTYKLG
jgi:hypothetical protein